MAQYPGNAVQNTFLLVICEFSGFTWLFAMDTTDTQKTFTCLNKLFCRYGLPILGIVSDRGSTFTSHIMFQIASVYGVNWTHNGSTSPTSIGLVEGRVKICKTPLSFLTFKNTDIDPYDCLLDLQFLHEKLAEQCYLLHTLFFSIGLRQLTHWTSHWNLMPIYHQMTCFSQRYCNNKHNDAKKLLKFAKVLQPEIRSSNTTVPF